MRSAEWQVRSDLRVLRTPHSALRAPHFVVLPSYEDVCRDKLLFAEATRIIHNETNPYNAKRLVQFHDRQAVVVNPPQLPISQQAMDRIYGLPYTRRPHPSYREPIPAFEMIKDSVTIMRGCFGGCTFCSITEHEGRIIQNRSEGSILREIETIRDHTPGYTGIISDLGGPTANMWRLACKSREIEAACRKPSCVYPDICGNLGTDHTPLIRLYRKARALRISRNQLVVRALEREVRAGADWSPGFFERLSQAGVRRSFRIPTTGGHRTALHHPAGLSG